MVFFYFMVFNKSILANNFLSFCFTRYFGEAPKASFSSYNPQLILAKPSKNYDESEYAGIIAKFPEAFDNIYNNRVYVNKVGEAYIPNWPKIMQEAHGTYFELIFHMITNIP